MKKTRISTLLIGTIAGVVYAFLAMLLVTSFHENVSVAYIFILPIVLGAIPVFFSTKEQLNSYTTYLLLPWVIVITFFFLSFITGFEGIICLVVIIGAFLLLGSLGAYIFRLIKLKNEGNGTKLYLSLFLPFAVLFIETNMKNRDDFYTVKTRIEIDANQSVVWQNVKNVRNIKSDEIATHFVHVIGIPRPLDGQLNYEGVGGVRNITWEKGIKFEEKIKTWKEGAGFSYDINFDPTSIPSTTLDEHVMIGGKYFDVVSGSYAIKPLSNLKSEVTLTCTYRISTSLNFYSKWWADFILDDF
ncbi:MAG: hypothetical protein ACO3E1_06020, partial [Flavobacteriales bacterium]